MLLLRAASAPDITDTFGQKQLVLVHLFYCSEFKHASYAGGNRVPKVKVTVHCTVPGRSKAFCWLVVGCLNDDSLMLSRYLDVASTTEPTELTAMLHSNISGDHRIVAAILSEKVIGGDTVTPVSYTCAQVSALQQARTGKIPPTLVNQDACLPESTEGTRKSLLICYRSRNVFTLSLWLMTMNASDCSCRAPGQAPVPT